VSDTDDELDEPREVLVFVSDEGRTVGVGRRVDGVCVGVCLAYLDAPVPLATWIALLRDHDDPERAADVLVGQVGGIRLRYATVLKSATILPPLAGGPVGEA
jgi:hypothetical protein